MGLDSRGTRTLVTWTGSCLSLGFILLLLMYGVQKMNIVVTRTG